MSGIGPLTARNFDGRGIRVIVIGDKGKGDAELYDSQKVRYEEWWSKKWGPKLVRTRYAIACFLFCFKLSINDLLVKAPFTSTRLTPVFLANRPLWSLV
jgi:hypothetical protein